MKRRSFFRMGLLGGLAASLLPQTLFAGEEAEAETLPEKSSGPIVLSTWSHGMAANAGAWEILSQKGAALDAVMEGVMVTENDLTNRSVGIGGMPDRDGHVTLDACIMDHKGRCGAVGFVEGCKHPVKLARTVMEKTQHVMLVGKGAEDFAAEMGFERMDAPLPEVQEAYDQWKAEQRDRLEKPQINHENHDTIGMIALDTKGNLSGSCTTSGWAYKMHGRLGDSPIIGAGLFVDNEVGAAVGTGLGEAIIRVAGSHTVVECMRHGASPQEACEEAVRRIIRVHDDLSGLQCAFIAMDKKGRYGAYSVYEGFQFAVKSEKIDELKNAPFSRKW